jgi:hypothetical protein
MSAHQIVVPITHRLDSFHNPRKLKANVAVLLDFPGWRGRLSSS